jgi:hypothetical protein
LQALLPGAQLGRELLAEILGLEHLTDLDLALAALLRQGQRSAQSFTSCLEFARISQKPAISSAGGANGPSITVRLPSGVKRTRAPFELACRPSAASSTPALASSSLKAPISANSRSLGSTPASLSRLALTIIMKRMVCLLGFGAASGTVPPPGCGSTADEAIANTG